MDRYSKLLDRPRRWLIAAALPLSISVLAAPLCSSALAQQALENGDVEPMGHWVEFQQVRFAGVPILLHLRTGYERAVVMPEPVQLEDEHLTLPGSEVVIDKEVVGFYPTENFPSRTLPFLGLSTGTVYVLRVSASPNGMRQPMQINR